MLFDFAGRLRDNARLLALLGRYAEPAIPDQAAWRDRVMELDGADPREVTTLHGELIAFGWVEPNPGHVRVRADGTPGECYRATAHGLREYGRITGREVADETADAEEKAPPLPPRRRRVKSAPQTSGPTEEWRDGNVPGASIRGHDDQAILAETVASGAVAGE